MRDPHVQTLRYRFGHGSHVSYKNPSTVNFITEDFEGILEDGVLLVKLVTHFDGVAEARSIVERHLRAWELHDRLQGLRDEIVFHFEDAEVIDRDPPPPGSPQVIEAEAATVTVSAGSLSVHVGRGSYPAPPQEFVVTPDVETMWHRYVGHREGKEPLLSMAFFCLSVLEASAGNREAAAKQYRIHNSVLRKIGELTSTRGDGTSARKKRKGGSDTPLSPGETKWLEETLRRVIARAAEIAGGKKVEELGMSDLPKL
jgi:hypothetical protein